MRRRDFIRNTMVCAGVLACPFGFCGCESRKRNGVKKAVYSKYKVTKPENLIVKFHLTEHCNLNCKGCAVFSPLAEEEFCDINQFEKDIIQLSKITNGKIKAIRLMGGEPLLCPDIPPFLNIVRQSFSDCSVRIMTNGILLNEMEENFWLSCKKNNVSIHITRYPIDIDMEKIQRTAEKYEVRLTQSVPRNEFHKVPLDFKGKQNIVQSYENCPCEEPTFIKKGKIYACPILGSIGHFNKYFNKNLPVSKNDYLDLHKIKDFGEIAKFTQGPADFCKYCRVKDMTYFKWTKSKKKIEEWV